MISAHINTPSSLRFPVPSIAVQHNGKGNLGTQVHPDNNHDLITVPSSPHAQDRSSSTHGHKALLCKGKPDWLKTSRAGPPGRQRLTNQHAGAGIEFQRRKQL